MPKTQPFHQRVKDFRNQKGFSQEDLAKKLGVSNATIARWETQTSKPSNLAVTALKECGFGEVGEEETNQDSLSRIDRVPKHELRKAVKQNLSIKGKNYDFDPAPYVVNGPENQLSFFEKMISMQENMSLASKEEIIQRLSIIQSVDGQITAQSALEETKSTAKSWSANYGSHGWHRYIGRFPPHLVRALINSFNLKRNDLILDPFVGSGTTLVEARLLGMRAIGVDICPLSALLSRAKSQFPENTKNLRDTLKDYKDFYHDKINGFLEKHPDYHHKDVIERQGNAMPHFTNIEKWFTKEALLGTSITVEFISGLAKYEQDFFACQLSALMRSIGNVEVNVVRAEYSKKPRSGVDVFSLMQRKCAQSIESIDRSLHTHNSIIGSQRGIHVYSHGIQRAEIEPNSIDAIITSPPYGVESISYLRTHLLSYRSLEPILGHDPYSASEGIIGSEYITKPENLRHAASEQSKTYGRFFAKFDQEECPKKLWLRVEMMMKFFDDMSLSGMLMATWLKPKGKIAFVIGNKKLDDHIIPTNEIISEIFKHYGLRERETIKHKLKTNNSNSQVPWQDRIIQDEYVIVYEKE